MVAVGFWHGNVVLEATFHRGKKRVNDAENKVATRDVVDDEAEGDEVVDAVDVLVVLCKLFVEGIDGFDAAVAFVFDMLFLEGVFDGLTGFGELLVRLGEVFLGKLLEELITLWVEVTEGGFFDFDADVPHLEAVGERRENFKRLTGNFLLLGGWESAKGAKVVEAVGELDDKDANVLTGRN